MYECEPRSGRNARGYEQQKLSGYIVKALGGEGPFSAEDLNGRMDFLKEKCEERRMIASALIERVTVYPGYELEIQFRVGIDSLAQLPGGNEVPE